MKQTASHISRTNSNQSNIVVCGSNEMGQFGTSSKKGKQTCNPKFLKLNIKIMQISCGYDHSILLDTNKLIYSMGNNEYGKLGVSDLSIQSSSNPILIESLSKYKTKKVSCGFFHSAAITESGEVFTWGKGTEGQLGNNNDSNSCSPEPLNFFFLKNSFSFKFFSNISCGIKHTMVLTENGQVFGWGSSDKGQLGTGKKDIEFSPIYLSFFAKKMIKSIACGYQHTLFLTKNKTVYSTGNNSNGELGIDYPKHSYHPNKIVSLTSKISSISASSFSAAISEKGELYIWGRGVFGEFMTPYLLKTNENPVTKLSIGKGFGILIDNKDCVSVWGDNQYGQLGISDFNPRIAITENNILDGVKINEISCGGNFFIGVIENEEKINDNSQIQMSFAKIEEYEQYKSVISDNENKLKGQMNYSEQKYNSKIQRETLRRSDQVKTTIKVKNLFNNQEEDNFAKNKIEKNSKSCVKNLSNSFDLSNTAMKKIVTVEENLNSIDESINSFNENIDDKSEDHSYILENLKLKNNENTKDFLAKIQEYEKYIEKLKQKEKENKNKMILIEKKYNKKIQEKDDIISEFKTKYNVLINQKEENKIESIELKKLKETINLYEKEKIEWKKMMNQQNEDINFISISFSKLNQDIEAKDKEIIKLYNLKEKDKRMIKILKSELEEKIIKIDEIEKKKTKTHDMEIDSLKQRIEKKDQEISNLRIELDEAQNNEKLLSLEEKLKYNESKLRERDEENNQMKRIIMELNSQNKLFREEFEKIAFNSKYQEISPRLETPNSKQIKNDEVSSDRSRDINLTEESNQLQKKNMDFDEYQEGSISENDQDHENLLENEEKNILNKSNENILKNISNKKEFNENKLNNQIDKENYKICPEKIEVTNIESVSSSVYDKIVLSNKNLFNIKNRLQDIQKNKNVLEERMKDFENKLIQKK